MNKITYFIRGRRSLTLIELLAVVCVILTLVGIFATYASINLRVARKMALQSELMNIRMSIEHYRILKGKFPESLPILVNEPLTYGTPDSTIVLKQFLQPFRVDRQGNLLDPFMNRYSYSNINGTIYSSTERYKRW